MKRFIFSFFLICLAFSEVLPGARPVHTYSIVAFDPETGQLGVAVQSHWFSVGSLVPWAKAGVGAVATQSFVKVEYGPDGLKLMEQGFTANQALEKLVAMDEGEAVRQVAMIDINGNVDAHTGNRCIYAAGDQQGKNYSVQANLMEHETVWPAMAEAFESASGDLADRMMAALTAAEARGGDIRGKQSAAMLIVTGEPSGIPWKDKVLDLRIDDHPEPLQELRRLIRVHRAYQHANKGDLYVEHKEIEKALTEYKKAAKYYPENPELPYWSAVTLADIGRVKEALPIFRDVFSREPRLRTLIPRLAKSGLLPENKDLIDKIISIK